MNKKIYGFLLLVVMTCLCTTGTTQVLPTIGRAFDAYRVSLPQEKVFVQTDKDFYLAGELVWFKVYVLNAFDNNPTELSKVSYVEVIDKNNIPVLQAKIAIKSGMGNGSFYIPVTTLNGNYKLRSYTNLMKNISPDLYFEKPLTIVNPHIDPEKSNIAKSEIDLQFFPEGGDLVEGVKSKVGFKVTGQDGLGKSFSGVIINQRNDTITKFKTSKFGLGQFSFIPQPDNSYKGVGRSASGEIVIRALPIVKKVGTVLSVTTDANGNLDIRANSSSNQELLLLVHNSKNVIVEERLRLSNQRVSYALNKGKLGDGVNRITLFDLNGQPLAERLYFKRPSEHLNIVASLSAGSFNQRQKVDVELSATDQNSTALQADVSLSVYKLDSLQQKDPSNIVSYIWLQSELKGIIESPDYYLNNTTQESAEALENLLLTQGWRRFAWNKILQSEKGTAVFLPEYNGHLVYGNVQDRNGKRVPGIELYLATPDKRIQAYSAISDAEGNFVFNTKDLYGQNEFIVQASNQLDSLYKINISQPFSEQFSQQLLSPFRINTAHAAQLRNQSVAVQVQNVYSGSKFKQFYYPGIDSTAFFGSGYKTYRLDNYVRFTTLEEVFREYVKETFVSKKQNKYHIKVLSDRILLENDPLILLDGVPYFDLNRAFAIDPLKVERMDIVNSRYIYGPSISDGIISLKTFKGDLGGTEINPHATILDYEGMQLQREFYSPVYSTSIDQSSHLPDFRNVLYWSPDVLINGKTKVNFYTSDLAGSYIGIIQGISKKGIPGAGIFSFDVNNK